MIAQANPRELFENLIGLPVLNRFAISLDMDGSGLLLEPNGFDNYHDHSFADGIQLGIKPGSGKFAKKAIVYIKTICPISLASDCGLRKEDYMAMSLSQIWSLSLSCLECLERMR